MNYVNEKLHEILIVFLYLVHTETSVNQTADDRVNQQLADLTAKMMNISDRLLLMETKMTMMENVNCFKVLTLILIQV